MTLNACFSSLYFLRAGVTEVHPHTHSGGGSAGDPQGSVTAMSHPYPWSFFYWLRKVSVPWKACNCTNSNQAPSQGQLPSLESQPHTLGREKKSKQLALLGCSVIPWQRQSQSTYISTTKGKRLVWTGNNPQTSLCLCRVWRVSHHSPSLQTSPKKHSPTGCQAIANKMQCGWRTGCVETAFLTCYNLPQQRTQGSRHILCPLLPTLSFYCNSPGKCRDRTAGKTSKSPPPQPACRTLLGISSP